jgi:MinD-like ATPase involved in chromosome partitioning or flagellar assembly
MNSIRIKVSIKDSEYAAALADALSCRYPEFHPKISCEDSNGWDVLLVDSDEKKKCERMRENRNILGLCNYRPKEDEEGFIYRYSGVAEISSRILICLGEEAGKCLKDGSLGKIFGFTGASGGVGKTVVAIAAARELASRYKGRILYISLEEIESTAAHFPNDMGKANLSDYLYYLFTERKESADIRAFVLTDSYGVDGFRPSCGLNELRGLDPGELSVFFNAVTGQYDYVIADFGGHPLDVTRLLFSLCSKVLLIDDSKLFSFSRNQILLRFFCSDRGHHSIKDKFIVVHNRWTEECPLENQNDDFFIENDEQSFIIKGNAIQIDIHSRFGMGVKKLAEQMYKKS